MKRTNRNWKLGIAVSALVGGAVLAPTGAMASTVDSGSIDTQVSGWVTENTYKTKTECTEVGIKNATKVYDWKCVNASRPHDVPKWNYDVRYWF